MQQFLKHVPFVLVILLVLVMGLTDQAVDAEPRAYITLLAPILWLGLYLLFGSNRTASKQ